MIRGSCLCGAVQFEVTELSGPFELCHCSRCRKSSGSAFAAGIGVQREHYTLLTGKDLIGTFTAKLLGSPPAYTRAFCRQCGCQVPTPDETAEFFEIPAGLLDSDPKLRPDKHIFVDCKSTWFDIDGSLPQLDKAQIHALRISSAPNQ
jgi:hypothetical protein